MTQSPDSAPLIAAARVRYELFLCSLCGAIVGEVEEICFDCGATLLLDCDGRFGPMVAVADRAVAGGPRA